jgi:pimeloyl-ACP methyl ester carboxylesterase
MASMFQMIFLSLAVIISVPGMSQYKASANGHFLEINGANIYYEEFGHGEPLLLLHGFGRTLEDWKPFIPEYAKNYRVLAWDMRGHGRSTGLDTGDVFLHAKATNDLLEFIRKLKLANVRAIGHSSGGIILLSAATLDPALFKAIIPVSAQTFFGDAVRQAIKEIAQPGDYYKFNQMEEQHGATNGMILSKQFYHFHLLKGDPDISREQLKAITANTLVVHGDNDFVPVSQSWGMFENIPNARLWVVPNGWHLPHLGERNTPDFIRVSSEFLRGEWSGYPTGASQ